MKKTALLLAVAMLASSIVGCSENTENTDVKSDTTGGVSEENIEVVAESGDGVDFSSMSFTEKLQYDRSSISDNLPSKNYNDEDFVVCYLDQGGGMYTQDWIAEELNGEVVNDATYNRNITVEDRFGIKKQMLSAPNSGEYSTFVRSSIISGSEDYSLISLHPAMYADLLLEGNFINLMNLDIDFTKPWYVYDSIESYGYNGAAYVVFGNATSITLLADAPIMFYNKNLAADYGVENLYDVVREGRWTYDYLMKTAAEIWNDTDGDGKYSNGDTVGFVACKDGQSYRLAWQMGVKYVIKDSDGNPAVDLNNERTQAVFDAAREMFTHQGILKTDGYSSDPFIKGNSLFVNCGLCTITSLRDVEFEYGILPNFKYDEDQEKYVTHGGGGPLAIPVTVADKERSAILMTAFSAESYKQVIPAYYETACKSKMSYDVDSAEMLDITFSNIIFEGSYLWCHSITYSLSGYIDSNNGYGSWEKSNEKLCTKTIERNMKTLEKIAENGN